MESNDSLGAAIKIQLYRMSKTQKWLAGEVGVTAIHISQVINNKSRPSRMLLIGICRTLNLDIKELSKYAA